MTAAAGLLEMGPMVLLLTMIFMSVQPACDLVVSLVGTVATGICDGSALVVFRPDSGQASSDP